MLEASNPAAGDRLGQALSASGQTLATSSRNGSVYVFTEPASGWAGVVHEAAMLTASDGAALSNPVISGQTIFAQGAANNAPGAVYVFSEPTGGWSGAVHESAKLTAPDGTPGDELGASIGLSGTTLVAGAPQAKVGSNSSGAVYVFTEPAGGWSGTLHETAKLTPSDIAAYNGSFLNTVAFGGSVAISGDTIVASLASSPAGPGGVYVFTEPAGGWASETQTAKLVVPDGIISAGSPLAAAMLAISGDTIVVPGLRGANRVPAEFVFTKPSGGWSGTQSESATLVASNNGSLGSPVFSGQSVIAGALTGASAQTAVTEGWAYVFTEPPGGWSGAAPTATLSPSGNPTQVSFTSAAASGDTAAASGDGSAYVFTEPPSGWSTAKPAAQLVDSNGAQLGPVAISSGTIAALTRSYSSGPSQAVDVFSQPVTGWSGQLQQNASLVASDGASFLRVAVSGQTVFAATAATRSGSWVYVFTEPPGGWSGTIHEAARLQLPTIYVWSLAADGNQVAVNGAISGGTVVSAIGTTYVFTEPSGGWSGTVQPAATLSAPYYENGMVHVYSALAAGWSGTVLPAAELLLPSPGGYPNETAVTGTTVAIGAHQPAPGCPCIGGVWLFSQPSGGWHGILTAPPSASTQTDAEGAVALAITAENVFAGGQLTSPHYGAADTGVFAVTQPVLETFLTQGKPAVSRVGLAGLGLGKPKLTFTLTAGSYAPPIESFRLSLPRGLSFSHSLVHLRHGVSVMNVQPTTQLVHGALVVTLPYALASVAIQVQTPALVENTALRKKVRQILRYDRSRRHHRKKELLLRFSLRVDDAAGEQTQLLLTVRVR